MINKNTLAFLAKLNENNNKEWFNENKQNYLEAKENMLLFLKEVEKEMNTKDVIEYSKLYRIYADVRFTKDKKPYKPYMHASLVRAGVERRGGYFIGIESGNTIIGGGFYAPNKEDLLRIRKEIEMDGRSFVQSISNHEFKKNFGNLEGQGVKLAPKGFDKNHEYIHWIKKNQFIALRKFTDTEVLKSDFKKEVVKTLLSLRPFFDYMSHILTTDLNGESILKI